jgi:hypothetical protein
MPRRGNGYGKKRDKCPQNMTSGINETLDKLKGLQVPDLLWCILGPYGARQDFQDTLWSLSTVLLKTDGC